MAMCSTSPGVIRADEMYTAAELKRRMGLGDYTWRQLRRQLPIIELGRKQYVMGRDAIAFFGNKSGQTK